MNKCKKISHLWSGHCSALQLGLHKIHDATFCEQRQACKKRKIHIYNYTAGLFIPRAPLLSYKTCGHQLTSSHFPLYRKENYQGITHPLHIQHKVPQKKILWICLCFHEKHCFFWFRFSQLTSFLSRSFPKPTHSTAAQSFVAKLQREQSGRENDGSMRKQECHRPISHMASSDKLLAVAGNWNAWIWEMKSPLFPHSFVIRNGK